jgi:hypothetical protein
MSFSHSIQKTHQTATTKSIQCTVPTSSPAAAFVLEAADRIQFSRPLQEIFERLDLEDVRDIWQLEYLDSYHWENLGATMGLVSSVRRCLQEWKRKLKPEQIFHQKPTRRRSRLSELKPSSPKLPPEVFTMPLSALEDATDARFSAISLGAKKLRWSSVSLNDLQDNSGVITTSSPRTCETNKYARGYGNNSPPTPPTRVSSFHDSTSCIVLEEGPSSRSSTTSPPVSLTRVKSSDGDLLVPPPPVYDADVGSSSKGGRSSGPLEEVTI